MHTANVHADSTTVQHNYIPTTVI